MQINCKDKYLEKAKELDNFFINTFFEKKWGLNKNIPLLHIEGYDEHGQGGLWKRLCKDPYKVDKETKEREYLIIKNVLSRDQTVPHQHKLALFIYNLEPSYMGGSHWISTYAKDNVINYFDSFGMPPFQEMVNHAKRKNLTLLHQNQQIQNFYTNTCSYFCLYFLNEMHKDSDYFDLLQVFSNDTNKNEAFIERYFKKLEKNGLSLKII